MLSHFFNSLVATLPLAVRNSGGVAVFVRILWVATLLTMSICARIVVAVTLHEVNGTPNAKTCAKRDNQSLQYTNCAVEKLHINLAFCRCAAQKKLLKMKMPPLFLGGCVLVGQIYFVYVKGFIGLYDCRTGRHIPFHVKSVSFVEVGKVFVVRVFRDVVFVA
jgi:hypothetical protein